MNELLEKLLSSEVLSEETRAELTTAIQEAFDTAVAAKVEEAKQALVVEYASQFAEDREALIEAIDTKVEEMLKAEIAELHESIENFRDLEVEYAGKLVEEKERLANAVQQDMEKLVESLDTFLELRLSEEVEELKESIEEVKKNNLGRKIFETFKEELEQYVSADSGVEAVTAKLSEAEAKLAEREAELVEAQRVIADNQRKQKLEETLSTLQGRSREIMEAILKPIDTSKLQETYDMFIERVLHESVTKTNSEKESVTPAVETPVLAEGEEGKDKELNEGTKVVNGDVEPLVEDAPVKVGISKAAQDFQRLAGIRS